MPLSTGDFEAVSYSEAPTPPPRLPQLNRAPVGLPAHYAPPAAPNSLSPVAMAMARDAAATGPQRAQTYVIATRPSIRTGLSILLAGALIGGIVGITMRARQNAAEAAFAAQQMQVAANAPPPPSAAALDAPTTPPLGAPSSSPQLLGGPLPGSTIVIPPSSAVAIGKETKETKRVSHGGSHGRSFGAPRVAAPSRPAASKKEKDSDDGWTVASAGNSSDTKESASSSREPKERDVSPKEPKEPKEPKVSKRSKGGASDDASAVLKAAMGATENTL